VSKDSQQTDQLCHLSGVLQKTFQGYCARYIEVQHTFYEIRRSYLGSECRYSRTNDDTVPLISRKKSELRYKFEKRRPFVPRPVPPFTPVPERPAPDERIPVKYVNMFLTDDMIENLVEESNKYATEKTGLCPNFTKAEMTTYFGIYYLMGIVRLPKIDDYWRSDLRYSQIEHFTLWTITQHLIK
jgi:hypothetical protein